MLVLSKRKHSKAGNTMNTKILALIVYTFAYCQLLLSSSFAESPPTAEVGADLFKTYCVACHGNDARGNGPAAKALKKSPPDLRKISERNNGKFPTTDIQRKIDGQEEVFAHGSREMPVWGKQFGKHEVFGEEMARGKIQVIVEYLKTIQD